MATADSDGESSNFATCPICLDLYEKPKSLPCQHALCLKCAQDLYKDKPPGAKASCPTCRQKFCIPHGGVAGFKHHFYAQQMVNQERKRRENSCGKHKDKQVGLYCCDCQENICLVCFVEDHKDHKTAEITEAADNFKLRIDDTDKQIISAISPVRDQLEQTQQDAAEFRSKVEEAKKKVLATGDVVKRSVDDQINDVLMRLESVMSESAKQSESVQETYQLALVSMESFHTHSQELLEKGRPSDITRAGCELQDRATKLLNNDVTAVKYRPPHVTFTPADVTQVKRLNLIGELTVTTEEQPDESLPSDQTVESGQEEDVQLLNQASGTTAVLQDELIQAAERERQLQSMQLDKTKDDMRHLEKQLEQLSVYDLEQEMKQRDMGRVIQTLPEEETVFGVTSLDNLLYVLRGWKSSEQIEVYDIDTYRLLRCLTVPGLGRAGDNIVACKHNRCAYISDRSHKFVHRVALPDRGTVTHWPVHDEPDGLSLTDRHGVLVSCLRVRRIKEFSTDGQLLHVLTLPQDVVSPLHSIQLSSGQFIVCHGYPGDPLHRVCLMGFDGSVVKSFGGKPGSGSQQMNVPLHMAVDRNEFVYVVDMNNRRVLLLSPLLTYVRDVVTREQLKWGPERVHLDSDRGRLYVGDNERVVVVSV